MEGIEEEASVMAYWSLLKLNYRPLIVWILRNRALNWSWLKLKRRTVLPYYTFYRPPGSSPEILHDLNSSIESNAVSSRIALLDVILPYIDWSIDLPVSLGIGSQVVNNIFCELVGDNSLQQFVTGPTHISGSKLDPLLCNGPEIITDVLTSTPEQCGFSTDHFILVFTILLKSKRP